MGNLCLSLLLYLEHVPLTVQSANYDELKFRQLWIQERKKNSERNHAGMQKEELKVGGKTQTKWGPAGLQLIFDSSTSGRPRWGGRTYPATRGTHSIEISILEPVSGKIRSGRCYNKEMKKTDILFMSQKIISLEKSNREFLNKYIELSNSWTLICRERDVPSFPPSYHPIFSICIDFIQHLILLAKKKVSVGWEFHS